MRIKLFIICFALLVPVVFAAGQMDARKVYDAGDYKSAFDIWLAMANQGDPIAQNALGDMYRQGRGAKRDYGKARAWYTKSANQSNADAQFNLGRLYRTGKGGKKHLPLAAGWFTKSAEQGHAKAQYNLAVMYENGWGVKKDLTTASRWYKASAEQGNQLAKTRLAKISKIKSATNSNKGDPFEQLLFASKSGDVGLATRLLANDPGLVNRKDQQSNTSLMWSTFKGHAGVVKVLLQYDKKVNQRNQQG